MRNGFCKKLICILLCTALMPGCSYVSQTPFDKFQNGGDSEFTTLGLAPEFNYEVPESLPSILVDQVGYASDSSKVAFFRGELLPDYFMIIDADSGQEVYKGEICLRRGDMTSRQESLSAMEISHLSRSPVHIILRLR